MAWNAAKRPLSPGPLKLRSADPLRAQAKPCPLVVRRHREDHANRPSRRRGNERAWELGLSGWPAYPRHGFMDRAASLEQGDVRADRSEPAKELRSRGIASRARELVISTRGELHDIVGERLAANQGGPGVNGARPLGRGGAALVDGLDAFARMARHWSSRSTSNCRPRSCTKLLLTS